MKRYFEIVLGGILVLWPTLVAPAQEPVRNVFAERSASTLTPVDNGVQVDGVGNFAADDVSDRLWGGHFVAGAGVYILKPYFQNNPAFFTQTTAQTFGVNVSTSVTSTNQHDFCWGLDATPVVWLGYVSESGLGVRARWWLFDQRNPTSAVSDPSTTIMSASPAGLSIATPPSFFPIGMFSTPVKMFVNSNLKLDVWDFEATGETQVGRWAMLFSGGFRYAHLSQDYNAFQPSVGSLFLGAPFPAGEFRRVDLLSSGHNFNGAGPTIALEASRPIGNSGFSLFANVRGSMLFGRSKQQVDQPTITQFILFNPPPTIVNVRAASTHDTVLPVAELEMGVEYSRSWGAIRPFVRTGLVAMTWFDAGSASNLEGDLGFLGLSVTAGLTY